MRVDDHAHVQVGAADAVPAEEREVGHVRWSVWRAYGAAAGAALLATVFISLALTQARAVPSVQTMCRCSAIRCLF